MTHKTGPVPVSKIQKQQQHKMQPNELLNKVIEKLQLIRHAFLASRETDHIWL